MALSEIDIFCFDRAVELALEAERQKNLPIGAVIALNGEKVDQFDPLILQHHAQPGVQRSLTRESISQVEPLLEEVFSGGKILSTSSMEELRAHRQSDISKLDRGVRRMVSPHIYHVSVTPGLVEYRQEMVQKYSR